MHASQVLTTLSLGYCIGHLRLVFALPHHAYQELMPDVITPGPFTYIKWYTPFKEPDHTHSMYKVLCPQNAQNEVIGDVVKIWNIHRSCHLILVSGSMVPQDHTSSSVLDSCNDYRLNVFSDQHMYMSLF